MKPVSCATYRDALARFVAVAFINLRFEHLTIVYLAKQSL
jgi:hypothetical protein